MSDSKGDGWNGNIIAFKQDGVIVATFGDNFIEGKNYGPSIVRIKNNIQTQIVVAQKGNFTNEVGFVVKNSVNRLSPTQKYIFDSTLSIFGNDIGSNILTLITFTDGQLPPALKAIEEANVPSKAYFKFNNSGLCR